MIHIPSSMQECESECNVVQNKGTPLERCYFPHEHGIASCLYNSIYLCTILHHQALSAFIIENKEENAIILTSFQSIIIHPLRMEGIVLLDGRDNIHGYRRIINMAVVKLSSLLRIYNGDPTE